jgi:mannosyltransferase
MIRPGPLALGNPSAPQRILAWVAALIVLGLAIHTNTHKVLWTDEAFSLDTASGPLGRTFAQALHFELQPPIYYLVLNLWLRLWRSIEFARLLSTLFVLASLPLLALLGRRLGLRDWAVSLPLLAALCPYVLWSASEARPYGLVVFLTAAAAYLQVVLLTAPRERLRSAGTLYVGVWYLSILTFYYTGFLLLGQLVGAAIARRRTAPFLLCGVAVAVLLVPWIPTILMQVTAHPVTAPPASIQGNTPLGEAAGAAVWAFRFTLESLFFAPALRRPAVLLTLATCLAVAGVVYWRHRGTRRRSDLALPLAASALLPLGVLLGLKIFGGVELWSRYFATVVVSVLAMAALLIDRFPLTRGRLALGIAAALFGTLCVVSYQRISGGYEDWQSAARIVQGAEAPGDVIFVFEPDGILSFRYYYDGPQPVFGLPVDRPTATYSVERQAVHSVAQVAERVRAKVGPTGEFWIVTRSHHAGFGGRLLEDYVNRYAVLLAGRQLEGVNVRRFRLRPVGGLAGPSQHQSREPSARVGPPGSA